MGVIGVGTACLLSLITRPLADPGAAMRPQNARLQRIVQWSLEASPTIRDLAALLEQRGVIVWIVAGPCDARRRDACLQHRVTMTGVFRFLFVSVRDDIPPVRIAALIAHELQHALEAVTAGVTSADDFDALYQRIGVPCESQHVQGCYETEAARLVEYRALNELAQSAVTR